MRWRNFIKIRLYGQVYSLETIIEGIKIPSFTLLGQYNSKGCIISLIFRLVKAGVYQRSRKKYNELIENIMWKSG